MIRTWLVALSAVLLAACGGGGSHSSPPPSAATLSYPGPQTFIIHSAITPVAPTSTGGLTSFTVTPALPAGLSLASATGTLSGTPTALAGTASYTVSATAPSGATASATVSITVNDVAPSQVSYGAPAFTFTSTVPSLTLAPTAAGGAIVSWSVDPALPAGLNFSSTDGSISGTPTAAAAAANYVVAARNSGGQASVTGGAIDAATRVGQDHTRTRLCQSRGIHSSRER